MKNKKLILLLLIITLLGWFLGKKMISWYHQRQVFHEFRTNFAKKNINLNELVLSQTKKNEIPDILQPKFISVKEAEKQLKDSSKGVLVDIIGKKRFYPFNILLWHKVINDFFDGVPYSVTYSPWCDSAVVYKGSLNDQEIKFKDSGMLYKSNLVFYDNRSESFWSQGLGRAIAGDFLDSNLEILATTQVTTFKDIKINHAETEVLSQDTGYINNYSYNPYSGYLETADLPAFASYENKRFPAKEPMYVVPLGDKSLVFSLNDLPQKEVLSRKIGDDELKAGKLGSEILVTKNGQRLGGYSQLWFCWAGLHENDGIVWDIKAEELSKKAAEKANAEASPSASVSNEVK